ncbi:MAG: amino acid permease [Rhodospirillales bacterium]|nr:amino acid permease [Rhodospirillales bacterium]
MLTFWPLVLYGLSVIVGAGIYVAIGAVISRAGHAAPLSFLIAGIAAGLTGVCYAELAGRFPEASGGVAYVRRGFGSDRLAQLAGTAITVVVAVAAASIAHGAARYLAILLPVSTPALTAMLIVGFTAVAMLGVRESVGLAAAMGVIELAGLAAATAAGLAAAPDYRLAGLLPADLAGWHGALAGAFIAFFAFIGFETLANLAEEVKNPQRTVPRGIIGAVAASIAIYVAVALAAVLADTGPAAPLLDMFEGRGASVFAAVGAIAVANGVLVQIVMLGRLFYGMAGNGELPSMLARVSAGTGVPAPATVLAGAIVLAAAMLVPFERLLVLTNAITLGVFFVVDLALWRVQRREPAAAGAFTAPRWVPPLAAAFALALLLAEILA